MIEYNGTFSLRNVNLVTCRLHTFLTYWSQHSSSWILSFISIDRAIATNCIIFARKFCTTRSAQSIAGIIIFITALFNCHELIFLRLQNVNPSTFTDIHTTISPYRTNLSTSSSLITYKFDGNSQLIDHRNVRSMNSLCENTYLKILCVRNQRDVHISTSTNREILKYSKITIKRCEALKGSRYEYFWDNVSLLVLFIKKKKNEN